MEDSPAAAAAQPLFEFDKTVRAAVEPYKTTRIVKVLGWLSEIGDQPQMRGLAGSMLLIGLVRSDPRQMRSGLRMLLAHEVATAGKNFIKHRIDRTRPRSVSSSRDQEPRPGHSDEKEQTSFPSGHSAGALAAARAFTREYPEHGGAATALAGGVALAQIPRCAHYPSDVAAGLMVGLAAEAVVNLACHAIDGISRRKPQQL